MYHHLTLQDSQKRNLIITLIDTKINICENSFYCGFDKRLLNTLERFFLLRRKTRVYKFFVNGCEKQLKCPMLKFSNRKNVALWPSIKLANRKYPVHVYVYAAALYLSSKISMREAAFKTRKKFSLDSFSHSTLSRVLSKLSLNISELLTIKFEAQTKGLAPPLVERIHWSAGQTSKYKQLLTFIEPVLTKENEIEFCSTLNYNFFNKTQKFLL